MTKSYTRDALGQTIERCRVQKGLTQQQLGELAGYQAGAAVSISRVESGNVLPGQARLAGIAAALELSLVDLESAATERTREIETGKVPAGSAALAARRADDLAQWAKRLEQQAQHRAAVHSEVIEAFTDAYDRSLIQFFLPLVEVSSDFGGLDRAAESSRSRERTLPRRRPRSGSALLGAVWHLWRPAVLSSQRSELREKSANWRHTEPFAQSYRSARRVPEGGSVTCMAHRNFAQQQRG